MSDEIWSAPTPREEMLARVAARGNRIRAVRGAVNALVVLSVVGASALGVGAALQGLGGDGGHQVDQIAMIPEAPDGPSSETTGSTGTTDDVEPGGGEVAGPDGTTSPGGTGGSATTIDGGSSLGGTPTTQPSSGSGSGRPTGGSTSTGGTSSTQPTSTSAPSTTTEVEAPRVSNLRMKVDGGIPTDLMLCDDPSAVLAVEIEGADSARVIWNRAGESRSAEMVAGDSEWSVRIPYIDERAADVPVAITVEATGPGGTTRTSVMVPVADCTPLPPAAPEQSS